MGTQMPPLGSESPAPYPSRYPSVSGGAVRLTPIRGGEPIDFPVERLSSGGCVIGRDPSCDARVDEKTVSKRHARLFLDDSGRLFIEDLGSANGTWKKGGSKVTRETFASGDTVRFGAVEFRIELPAASGGRTVHIAKRSPAGETIKVDYASAPADGSSTIYAWLERLDSSGRRITVKATSIR